MNEVINLTATMGLPLVSPQRKALTMQLSKLAMETCEVGNFVETGVFTGGSTITLMKTLQDMDKCERQLWVFDSFEGLPNVQEKDTSGSLRVGSRGEFSASQELFESNMKAAGAFDNRLHIVKGWFNESLPRVKEQVGPIVFLRLDGDMYQSTKDVLDILYDQVVAGGLIYVDDYGSFNGCKAAVDGFFAERRIWSPLHIYEDDKEAAWWRKI
jgi:Macrocin-O-methyltransferase (TylF)